MTKSKRERSAARETLAGGADNSAVEGTEGRPGGEPDRAMVAKKPGNSGGAQGPALRHALEAEQVS